MCVSVCVHVSKCVGVPSSVEGRAVDGGNNMYV